MKHYITLLLLFTVVFLSCEPEVQTEENNNGKIILKFIHQVNAENLVKDSLMYVNDAGNFYGVNEIMYFISDVALETNSGKQVFLNKEKIIQYVDNDIPETQTWNVFDPIPEDTYDSIHFIFGLNEERNQSFAFVNPPEVNMFWPDILGGGYHYLMINGKWINEENKVTPFDFHLGIGQLYSGVTTSVDSITGFVHNYFRVALPLSGMIILPDSSRTITIGMEIDSWFSTPHTWDFDYWGGYIMQNQEAMRTACENGIDVFRIVSIE